METGESDDVSLHQLRAAIAEVRVSLSRIEYALCGNSDLGIKGVIKTMEEVSTRVQELEDDRSKLRGGYIAVAAIGAGALGLWAVIKEFLPRGR